MYPYVHYSILTMVNTWKQPKCCLDKEEVVHIYHGVLLSHEKAETAICDNMDGS